MGISTGSGPRWISPHRISGEIPQAGPQNIRRSMSDEPPRLWDVLVLLVQIYLVYVPWILKYASGAW
jgi:hypothetical protein